MNLLNRLTIKNLKLNKKRTVVTIIGIMLSVALITAVATMYSSLIKSLINFETHEKGNYHVAYYNVSTKDIARIENTKDIEKLFITKDIGYAKLEGSKNAYKPYLLVKGFTKEALDNLSINLVEGRLPVNEEEIVIPTHLKTNGRVTLNIGDTITVDIGNRVTINDKYSLNQRNPFLEGEEEIIDTQTKTYKIVGIIERPAGSVEPYSAPGYTFVTLIDNNKLEGNVDVYTRYTKDGLKEHPKIPATILEVDSNAFTKLYKASPEELDEDEFNKLVLEIDKAKYTYDINNYLITLEYKPLSDDTTGSLGLVVGIVMIIILVTSIYCIKNSFDISITEKIKQYGMLRSMGATKKQIKNNVFYEATILGVIGIPLGLLLGLLASYILVIICNILLNDSLSDGINIVLSYSWVALLISLVLGVITIYFSALRSAKKASKVSPISSIRNSANIKISKKTMKCPKIISKIFKIGGEISYKNMKRNKKKYRTTTISIIISVSIFIALSYFMSSAFDTVKQEVTMYDYNIGLFKNESNKVFEEKALEALKFDNINDYSVEKMREVKIKNPLYNQEYITLGGFDEKFEKSDNYISIVSINDEQYQKYIKELNLDYDEVKDKAILLDTTKVFYEKDGKTLSKELREYAYKVGDIVNIYNEFTSLDLEVSSITTTTPFGSNNTNTRFIVSEDTMEKLSLDNDYTFSIYFDASNPNKLQDDIDTLLQDEEYNLNNIEENAKVMKNLFTLIAIFLYGFIIVISLIGITNIFNTITTSMELRSQEFAMLKSIGMTKREFNNMIRFESLFIGLKSLVIGIPIGTLLSYLLYLAFNTDIEGAIFKVPILAIIISIMVVYLLIFVLMKYSMKKINRQNTIETIRNENI